MKEEFRKYLHVHSQGNIIDDREKRTKAPMFDGIRRAGPTSKYPNIVYGFKEPDPKKEGEFLPASLNVNGVYDVTALPIDVDDSLFYNNNSLIKQEETDDDPDYMLENIISVIQKRTGIPKGIFILMGCLVSKDAVAMDETGVLMETANAEYPTMFETLTADELAPYNESEIPRELGSFQAYIHPLSEEMALSMVKEGLYTKNNSKWVEDILPNDRNQLRQKLKTMKGK
jgi:hypothetical protein